MASNTKNTSGGRKTSASANNRKNTKPRSSTGTRKKNGQTNVQSGGSLSGDIFLIVSFGFTVLLYLANFRLCGKMGVLLTNLTFGLFGLLGYISPILVLIAICFFVNNSKKHRLFLVRKTILFFVLFILTCSFFSLFSIGKVDGELTVKSMYEYSMKAAGGGLFGNAIILMLYPKFGPIASFIIVFVVWAVDFLVVTDFSLIDWIEYRVSLYKQSSVQQKEIKEIKHETTQHVRAAKLDEKRLKNEERIKAARANLERYAREQAELAQKESNDRLGRDETPTSIRVKKDPAIAKAKAEEVAVDKLLVANPVKDNDDIVIPSRRIKRTKEEERRKIPSFLFEPDDNEDEDIKDTSDIVPVKNEEPDVSYDDNNDFILENELKNIHQMRMSELDNKEEASSVTVPKTDGLIRKPFAKVQEEDERVIELSGGKILNARMGMGALGTVEAEGTEKDPHGTGHEYEEEDEIIPGTPKVVDKPEVPEKKYIYPPYNLLKKGSGGPKNNKAALKETAERLQKVLESFGVGASVTDVTCGPSVTRYELTPDTGVKVSKIVSLQDDIKLNLAAADIRIEAPIPGKAAVGIEVPNKDKSGVTLREMLESEEFRNHKSRLAFTAGKDIGGDNIIGDLAKMPHVLIAGTTGSGKSVCVNTIIVSILYHSTPSEVKMLMIDPKVVELKVYNGIPHLLRPVITDPKQATGALNWAVTEMNRRYKLFAESNVRDLSGYNDKVKAMGMKPIPQIVIIVDELADLMMSAPNEVEDSIQHLAQMARAAGMHLILITQRPTVNVVTGTIKANIPSRIALTVASGTDSRTMIDMVGAEKLLGNGDMLYFPVGMQKPIRLQGPYVSDEEINAIVDFLKKQKNVEGGGEDESIKEIPVIPSGDSKSSAGSTTDDDRDALLAEAGEFIITSEKASIGMLQRKFRIGFNRAARIMDQLADMGVVGPEEGTKPRNILIDIAEFKNRLK